jgi:hypothetical protein
MFARGERWVSRRVLSWWIREKVKWKLLLFVGTLHGRIGCPYTPRLMSAYRLKPSKL